MRSLESTGVRLVVALLHVLGVAVGSFLVLLLAPVEGITWLPISALVVALGAVLISWRPFMYFVVGWSASLVVGCVLLLVELGSPDAPIGVLLMLTFAGGCFLAGGLLELQLARRRATGANVTA